MHTLCSMNTIDIKVLQNYISLASLLIVTLSANDPFQLPRREPIEVGHLEPVTLVHGKTHFIKTISVRPPIFEVPGFLTHEECNHLIHLAKIQGLQESPTKTEKPYFKTTPETFALWDSNNDLFIEPMEFTFIPGNGDLYLTELEVMQMIEELNLDINDDNKIDFAEFNIVTSEKIQEYFHQLFFKKPHLRSRRSKQTWLWHHNTTSTDLLSGFHQRMSRLTLLPRDMIAVSEPLQVVHYKEGGHYHCHHDSDEFDPILPCCTYTNQNKAPCRQCRYVTVMFFLNNVSLGGETAFQVADNETFSYENWESESMKKCNLADNCEESNIIVKPEMGKALLWYNHLLNETNGWLGSLDPMTYHGGCDVIDIDKWIANMWINVVGGRSFPESKKGWLGYQLDVHKEEL